MSKGVVGNIASLAPREVRGLGATVGASITTTASLIPVIKGTDVLDLTGRNYSTAVVIGYALTPYLAVLKTADDLATPVTDYSTAAQDVDAATDVDLSSLSTLANGDYLLIGSPVPFRGLVADIDAANGNAATILVQYWNGTAWTDISATDGTASAGATFAVDGNITWTVPASWTAVESMQATGLSPAANASPHFHRRLYWIRVSVSAALDSTTTLNSLRALSRSTAYGGLVTGVPVSLPVVYGHGGIAAIEAVTDAGTANLLANARSVEGFA